MRETMQPNAPKCKNGDWPSWRHHLAAKRMKFRVFGGKQAVARREISIVHQTGREDAATVQPSIPNDEECRRFLISLGRPGASDQPKSAWSDDDEIEENQSDLPGDGQGQDTENEQEAANFDGVEDEELWQLEKMHEESVRHSVARRRTVDANSARSSSPSDDCNLKIRNYSIRGYSPHAHISEATQLRMVRVDSKKIEKSQISPHSTRDYHERDSHSHSRDWEHRPSVSSGLSIRMMRRPSRPEDALCSHPVQFRIREDSVTDPLCRVCYVGVAESWGVCQNCEDDGLVAEPRHDAFQPYPQRTSSKAARHHVSARRNPHPPPLNQFSFSRPNRHVPTPSHGSDPESNLYSEPPSPSTRTIRTALTIDTELNTPETPLSDLSTPEVYRRFERELGRALEECEHAECGTGVGGGGGTDMYDGEWADYYFNKDNSHGNRRRPSYERSKVQPMNHQPYGDPRFVFRGGQRTESAVHREVNSYMVRNLSLSEYEGAFSGPGCSPTECPGPGWI